MSSLKRIPKLHLMALFLESILVGWLMSNYDAHCFIFLGTKLVALYLAWVGADAIVLSIAWVVVIVWIGVLAYSVPSIFQGAGIVAWAGSLAFGWFLGLVLILTLAFAKKAMQSMQLKQIQSFLLRFMITWLGLGIGLVFERLEMVN